MNRRVQMLTMLVVLAGMCSSGFGRGIQHLVDPGDNWSALAERVRPGDEIVLMPGSHRPALLANVRGTADRPITVRSLDTEYPGIIRATRYGIQLIAPRHVHLRDLIISGASVNALEIEGADDNSSEGGTDQSAGHIVIKNVTIERTGPIGRRNAVLLRGIEYVTIEHCHFRGWGGSAIEVIACLDVSISHCRFEGIEEFSQMNAVQIRAGSEQVRITHCTMIDAGVTGVAIGGDSRSDEFRQTSRSTGDAKHEARRVRVTSNVFRGGLSAVAFINCDQSHVRNNTVVRPRRWGYLVLDKNASHLAPTRNSTFAVNLIHWQPGDLQQFSFVREDANAQGLLLEQNLWWADDLNATKDALGTPAGTVQFPQITDVDPQLDDRFVPTERRAATFGYDTP